MKQVKKKKASKLDNYPSQDWGKIAFSIGIVIAIIMTLVASFHEFNEDVARVVVALQILIGIVVGFLNITTEETREFLLASLVLVVLIGPFLGLVIQMFPGAGATSNMLEELYKYLVVLIVPAATIVALKSIFRNARD